jgi:hypothetical protein
MRILIIPDVHANIEALETLNERYNHLICLGDLVDYGPSRREALQFLQERASYGVRGNHDTAVGFRVDCQCVPPYRELSIATRDYMWEVLGEDDLAFLRSRPVSAPWSSAARAFISAMPRLRITSIAIFRMTLQTRFGRMRRLG